jgi:hypothetical protein
MLEERSVLYRVFLMFGLYMVFSLSAKVRKVTLEERLYARTLWET